MSNANLLSYLRRCHACQPAIDWLGERDLAAAWAECPNEDWMIRLLDYAELWTAAEEEEYERVTAVAWAEYRRMRDAAWEEFLRVTDATGEEYRRVSDSAWEKYGHVSDAAAEEFQRVRAAAWEKYERVSDAAAEEYERVSAEYLRSAFATDQIELSITDRLGLREPLPPPVPESEKDAQESCAGARSTNTVM